MLQHQDRILVDIEIGIVDARRHVVIIFEHDRLARMAVQAGFGRGRLDDRAVGGEIAAQDGEAVGRDQRIVQRPNDVFVVIFACSTLSPIVAPFTVRAPVFSLPPIANCLSTAGKPPA